MEKRVILVLFAVAILSFTVSTSMEVDGADPTVYKVEGYIVEGGGVTGKIPMGDVVVTITDLATHYEYTGISDDTGLFSVPVPTNANLQIGFAAHGYTLITCPNITGDLMLDLTPLIYNAIDRTYMITSGPDGWQCVVMAASIGSVKGLVSYDRGHVMNATVTLMPSDGDPIKVQTNRDGEFSVKCPTGEYVLIVSCTGFKDSEPQMINVNSNNELTIPVTLTKSEVSEYLGMDIAHLLMLLGVILSLVLATIAWVVSRRMNEPNGLEIIDDSTEEEDDLIRHP